MNHNPKVCFFDALTACEYIIEFTAEISFEQYLGDHRTRFAVERQFEILGEALNRIKKLDPDLLNHVTDWQDIILFRNIVIHAYDRLNDGIVFDSAINDVPKLAEELRTAMNSFSGPKSK